MSLVRKLKLDFKSNGKPLEDSDQESNIKFFLKKREKKKKYGHKFDINTGKKHLKSILKKASICILRLENLLDNNPIYYNH